MKPSLALATFSLALFPHSHAHAHPDLNPTIHEIRSRISKQSHSRRNPQSETPNPNDDGSTAPILLDDLGNPPPGGLSATGQTIANILLGKASAEDYTSTYTLPGPRQSKPCAADSCCKWAYVARELSSLMRGPTGRCNKYARAAVRLGFHDAGSWEEGLEFGGADGSIILAKEEMWRKENRGLEEIVGVIGGMAGRYGVVVADLVQFAATVGVVVCPLGPRIRFFAGRKDSSKPSQLGLLPGVNDSADTLIALFHRKTIPPHDLVALLGAHTTSEQFFVDPKRSGAPQDGTPGVWDTLFYNQTLGLGPMPKKVLRFPSDVVLAKDPRTRDEWEMFSRGEGGQKHWNEDYARSYVRVSLLGVNNINNMTECTKVLPMLNRSVKDTWNLLVNG